MSLVQLTYVSSAARGLESQDPKSILEVSVRRNSVSGLTGLLLYSEGGFMHALEGDEVEVEATMKRIAADTRHSGLIVLARRPIAARALRPGERSRLPVRTRNPDTNPTEPR